MVIIPDQSAGIDRRLDQMIERGLLDEVRRLLEAGLSPDSPAMSAIGYRQLASYLSGEMSLEDSVRAVRKATRLFVRRQANWFKADDPRIVWFDVRDIAITFFDRNRGLVSTVRFGPPEGTSNWTELRERVPVPRSAQDAVVMIGLTGATGRIAFDDIRMVPALRQGK